MLEEPTTTATLAEPTAIWFDTHYDSKSSGLYCIEQIKAYVLDDDNAFEVDQWRDADLVHLNTIPFRRRDVGVWRSSKPMVVTQHGGYHWWRSRRDLLERPDHPDLHAHASDIQTHVPPAPADRFQYRVHQATRGRQGRRAGRPDASDPARSGEEYEDVAPTDTDDPFVLVVVNNRNPRKNVPTIVETMAELSDVRFVLPGKMWGDYPTNSRRTPRSRDTSPRRP